ncbi:pathogenicity determinant protein PdpA1, partial [Francisella tularensis subsp. holarctica]|nr:pathogenicity determinant protein PdpA1 [Francisella tularensis subsp. holarctica]
YKLLNINLINTQLKNTKILDRKGLLSKLDYEKYKRYCVICRLKNNIYEFILYFSTNYKDSQSLKIAIKELQHSCSSSLILELPHDY